MFFVFCFFSVTGGRFLITPMYGLTIDNVTLDDEGDYICQGTVPNVGASENLRIFADVQGKQVCKQVNKFIKKF